VAVTETLMVRKAKVSDVPLIADIINRHAQNGIMLPRPLSRIYDNVRDFSVLVDGGEVVGCGALHVMWSDLAEIRAVALRDDYIGRGLGRPLIEALAAEARELEIERVFVLKIWNECVNCVHFPNCNEIAMILDLKGGAAV
jgi:amino-acid N-acetyltransferase